MILTIIFIVLTSIGISAFLLPSGLTDWIPDGLCRAILIDGLIGALGTVTAIGTYANERSSSGYEEHYDEWNTRYRGLAARIEIWKQARKTLSFGTMLRSIIRNLRTPSIGLTIIGLTGSMKMRAMSSRLSMIFQP